MTKDKEENLIQLFKNFPEGIYLGSNHGKDHNCSVAYFLNANTNMDELKQKLSTIIANNIETYSLFEDIMFLAEIRIRLKIKSN